MRLQTALGWQGLLFSSLFCTSSLAKKDEPGVMKTEFKFIWFLISEE